MAHCTVMRSKLFAVFGSQVKIGCGDLQCSAICLHFWFDKPQVIVRLLVEWITNPVWEWMGNSFIERALLVVACSTGDPGGVNPL